MKTLSGETLTGIEIQRTFEEIAQGIGCASCIAQSRVKGDSPELINIYERYRMAGLPGHEGLGDQMPQTD